MFLKKMNKMEHFVKADLNILLVDDHFVVRKGIELVLTTSYPKAIVHNAENYFEAIEILKTIYIDLIFLDIIINGIENSKVIKEMKSIQSSTKILIFTCHKEENHGHRYIKNGADGFLNKFCSEQMIGVAINQLFDQGYYYSDDLKDKMLNKTKSTTSINLIDSLSNREFEVAKLLVKGESNLYISNKLDLKMSTVSTYKNRIFEKLQINNVVALFALFKVKDIG